MVDFMADKILGIGNKIELTILDDKKRLKKTDDRTYVSQILDFDGDTVVAALPIYEGHLVTLEVGSRLDCYFYTTKGIYRGTSQITSRYKDRNLYLMKLELEGEVRKFQRRQYYRLPCDISVSLRRLDVSEVIDYSSRRTIDENPDAKVDGGIIVDISGGGIRVFTNEPFEKDEYVYATFTIEMNVGKMEVSVLTHVVMTIESHNVSEHYDIRLQYRDIPPQTRDAIVKYIYEQQRKNQSKGR
jgi:c-di-GMP-binding flagellar brake protein YcgR